MFRRARHPESKNQGYPGHGIACTLEELLDDAHQAGRFTLHLRRKSKGPRAGGKRSSVRGRGMEFFESRPYVAQDEMGSIDWKVSARLNTLFTKVFIEEKDRPIYLALDFRPHLFFGTRNLFKSVLMAKLAARLAQAAINGGDPVGALFFKDQETAECKAGASRKCLARLLGQLAQATQTKPQEQSQESGLFWTTTLSRLCNRVPRGSAVFLLSDFAGLDDGAQAWLHRLRKRCDVFALYISDPLEQQLPSVGLAGMAYGDLKLQFDSSDHGLREAYQSRALAERQQRTARFLGLDIPELSFSTADNIDDGLKQLFSGHW